MLVHIRFALGDKHVVLTSVEGDTQWMVGTIVAGGGGAPSFKPETGGYSDQGVDYYAAKTGGPAKLEPGSRRLLFAFNGWGGGVTEGTCGRYDVIPRELTLREGFLHVAPISELSQIQTNVVTTKHSSGARVLLRRGNQVQAVLNCSVAPAVSDVFSRSGSNVSLEVLATADGSQLARYGFTLDTRTFFIEDRNLKTTSSHAQTPYPKMPPWFSMVVLVDGGVVESFTDSGFSMASSPKQVPVPNGAVTTRSFLPEKAPFGL
jgi:sucrose-6-phosphate hydrolase SacC (GH32 family)